MIKSVFIIHFDTTSHFEKNKWDTYICKTRNSVSKKLLSLLKEKNEYTKKEIETIKNHSLYSNNIDILSILGKTEEETDTIYVYIEQQMIF